MDTGTRTGISYLANDGSDAVTAYRTSIRNIVTALEGKGVLYSQGTLASRPAAGTVGRWYKPTDTGSESLIYWDDGATWQTIGASATVDGSAATPSLRTLGSGATQASAGNHSHTGATPSYAYKTVDTARANDDSLTADPHLTLTLGVGTWLVDADLNITGSVNGDFAATLNFSGTATTRFGPAWLGPTSAATDFTATSVNVAVASSTTFGTVGAGQYGYVRGREVLVVTGSGTLTVNWGQAAAYAGATTLRAGSHLIATRLA
jgi:autotransporter-associated beta strand protein